MGRFCILREMYSIKAIVAWVTVTDTVYMAEAFGNGVFEVSGMRLVCFPSRPSSSAARPARATNDLKRPAYSLKLTTPLSRF